MTQKSKSPTSGAAGQALDVSTAANNPEFSTITVVCTGIAPSGKAVFCRAKSGNTACFPLSQVELVSGEYLKNTEITIKLPNWLLDRARQQQTTKPADIPFTAKVLVTGVHVDASAKAIQVRCDADMLNRWFAYSKVDFEGDEIPDIFQPVRLFAPAWLLRTKSGYYPSWVAGAIVG